MAATSRVAYRSMVQPFLGVSSLDLGRPSGRPLFATRDRWQQAQSDGASTDRHRLPRLTPSVHRATTFIAGLNQQLCLRVLTDTGEFHGNYSPPHRCENPNQSATSWNGGFLNQTGDP